MDCNMEKQITRALNALRLEVDSSIVEHISQIIEKNSVTPEWREIAGKLYQALLTETAILADREEESTEALRMYEQLIQKEDGNNI